MKKTAKPNNRSNDSEVANMEKVATARQGNVSIVGKYFNVYVITTISFILFCYLMLPVRNGYMLRWYDEMSLFESTRFFFRQCLYFPGGLMRYAGAWLTQLMYYPFLGSTVLIVIWLLTAWLTKKGLRLPRILFPVAFIVPMAMLVSVVQMDDAWLSIKSVGYLYSNSLSYLFVVAAICLYRVVERNILLSATVLLLTEVFYFFVGFYALFAGLMGVIIMVADCIRSKKYIGLVCAAVLTAVIFGLPDFYYQYFPPTTVDNEFLLLKGLPDLLIEKFDFYLWMPFIVASVSLLVLTIVSAAGAFPHGNLTMWVSAGVLLICGIWCISSDKKNEQLRATVLMLHYLEANDWRGIVGVMSRIKEPPNYTMRVINNFALINLGRQGENLAGAKPRNIDARHAEGFTMTALVNVPMNYYKGDFMLSYRWGMEHCVQYGKRVFFLKYMVKDALLNGEVKLAKRYNDILLHTLFHRKWAEEMNRYIEDPSLIDTNIEFKSILGHAK